MYAYSRTTVKIIQRSLSKCIYWQKFGMSVLKTLQVSHFLVVIVDPACIAILGRLIRYYIVIPFVCCNFLVSAPMKYKTLN